MKAICVLVNNIYFFERMVANLPKELNGIPFILFTETRIGNKVNEIKEVIAGKGIKYKIIESEAVLKLFKNEVVDTDFLNDYTMGMKLLAQWYVFKHTNLERVIFIDEDVILSKGISEIFKSEKSLFKYYRMSAGNVDFYKNSKNVQQLFIEMFKDFGITFNINYYEEYLKSNISSGNRYYCMNDFNVKNYEKYLKNFFNNKLAYDLWQKRKVHTSFYFDERFETLFAMVEGILNRGLGDYVYLELRSLEYIKSLKDYEIKKAIWHNATVSHKTNVYKYLIEKGVIK